MKNYIWLAYEKGIAAGGAITKTSENSDYDYDCVTKTAIWYENTSPEIVGNTEVEPSHNHGISDGTALSIDPSGSVVFEASGDHAHNVKLRTHYHPLVQDGLQHTHQMIIPAHTHDIQYGIFESPENATSVIVKVDGNVIPDMGLSEQAINIVPYLSKDSEGKINRGWHTVEITPNDLARITATVIKQIFIQSRGGGDY